MSLHTIKCYCRSIFVCSCITQYSQDIDPAI